MKTKSDICEKIEKEKEARRSELIDEILSMIDKTSEEMYNQSRKKLCITDAHPSTFGKVLDEPEIKEYLEKSGLIIEEEDFFYYLSAE